MSQANVLKSDWLEKSTDTKVLASRASGRHLDSQTLKTPPLGHPYIL